MLSYVDVVTAAHEDLNAAGFGGETALDLARETAAAGPSTVFVTEGRSGASAFASEDSRWGAGTVTHDGFSVDSVDVTGAGDAFTAGVLATAAEREREGERSLRDVLEAANRVAAASTLTAGGIGPLDVSAVPAAQPDDGP
jgi:fructokinase